MPIWGNTDNQQSKPHIPKERNVRPFVSLVTANATTAGSNTITFAGVGAATAANVGVVPGMYVYGGAPGILTNANENYFFGNNYVTGTSNTGTNNQVFLAFPVTGTIPAGNTITFDTSISWNNPLDANTNVDTILITATRSANNSTTSASPAIANLGNLNQGWNYIRKKVNGGGGGDSSVRYIKETLVALANASASNTFSGNTSAGPVVTGL